MKKIVGIIAAVAMAASVFALDDATGMSAGLRFGHEGHLDWWSGEKNLFKFNGSNVDLLDFNTTCDCLALSLDLGIVGGGFKVKGANGVEDANIWFKPFWGDDKLKITLNNNLGGAGDMLCGALDYHDIKAEGNKFAYANKTGYQVESKPVDNLKLGAVLVCGNGTFWSSSYDTNFYASYDDADSVGKIAAYFGAAGNFTNLLFGLGWKRAFGDDVKITPTLNVLGYANNSEFTKVRFEPTIAGDMDPVSWAVFVPVDIGVAGGTLSMSAVATVDFKINEDGAFTKAWLKYGYKDILSGAINMQFQVGCGGKISDNTNWEFRAEPTIASTVTIAFGPALIGNYGGMSWDLGAKFTIAPSAANAFSVVVPFTLALSL